MRIISGSLGGRKFSGKIPSGVRPTSDLARGSILNKLQNLIELEGATVADICAGTGAMGFECISRGAKYCAFVDSSKASCNYIKQSAEAFGIEKDKYSVINKKSEKFPAYAKEINPNLKFDLIITDPPYIENIINQLLQDIVKYNLLNSGGIIATEYSSAGGLVIPDKMQILDNRKFGETQISYINYK